MAKKITITDPYDLNNVSTPDETSPTLIARLTALEAEVKRLRERNRWSIKDKKFTGYKGAFNGLRAHHNSMMKLAINYLTHVTGSGDNSVEHYWKSDCNTCKEIASFIASWRPIVPPTEKGGE